MWFPELPDIQKETVRRAIVKDLGYSYKKIYFRSYSADDENIKMTRFWLAFELFDTDYF